MVRKAQKYSGNSQDKPLTVGSTLSVAMIEQIRKAEGGSRRHLAHDTWKCINQECGETNSTEDNKCTVCGQVRCCE